MLILLTGKIGSGKTTVSNYLQYKYKISKYALGDKVKEYCRDILNSCHNTNIPLSNFYDRDVKENYRNDMCSLSQIAKNYFGNDIWTQCLVNHLNPKSVTIIEDIRFKHEYNYFKQHFDCVLIRIIRHNQIGTIGYNNINITNSETDMDNVESDYTIFNNSDLRMLYSKIDTIIQHISSVHLQNRYTNVTDDSCINEIKQQFDLKFKLNHPLIQEFIRLYSLLSKNIKLHISITKVSNTQYQLQVIEYNITDEVKHQVLIFKTLFNSINMMLLN